MAKHRSAKTINFITGDKRLDAKLKKLASKASKYLRAGLSKGMSVLVKAMRRQAPVGETQAVKKSIGKRFKKVRRKNEAEAKCGVNVAKKKTPEGQVPTKGSQAPHAMLNAIGTEERQTTTGKRLGRMKPNNFIKRAASAAGGQAMSVIKQGIADRLKKDAK